MLAVTDSSFITGSVTGEDGKFVIEKAGKGCFILKITAIGFEVKYSEVLNTDSIPVVDLPAIALNPALVDLHEISVSSIKNAIEFKNGNIIVNIENSPLAKGNTIYDLLSKLPGVSIENNMIQLNGKQGVVVMLDGHVQRLTNTQLLNVLKSMSAELVEKIELLKNPPVKYDASGTSGMINIKTKKTKLTGFSGNIYTSSSQGFYGRSVSGAALNYKTEKLTLFSNIDYNYGDYLSKEKFNKKFRTDSSLTEFNSVNTVKDLEKTINYKIGADWSVGKKNVLGFRVDGGPGSYNSTGIGTNTIGQYNNAGFDHLDARVFTPDKWTVNNYNLNAEHRFDTTGTALTFTSDYTRLKETYANSIQNFFLDANNAEALPPNIYRSMNNGTSGIFASRLDFVKVTDTLSSFEAGAKASSVAIANNYLFERKENVSGNYYSDTALTNNYTYAEQTFAVYFNYIRSFKKGNLQAGIRAENTNLTGRNTERGFELRRSYYNLFPNISVEYVVSANHSFQLTASRRIDRPDYNNLNPFRSYRDQYSYFEGNPFLLPHYSNTMELTHNYKKLLTNSFTYTRIDNIMLFYTKQNDSTRITTETIKNMKFNNYYAYSFFINKSLRPWWELSANGLISYIEFAGDVSGNPFKTASFYYRPSLTNTFTAGKNTKIEMTAFYSSAKNNGLVQVRSRWMLSFAVKRSFLKEKLDCSIGVNDLFYSAYFRTGVKFDNQDWNFKTMQDSRRLVVSIGYNFGKTRIEERETSRDEQEKERLSH